ncbi:putative mitochondrial protein, partial [Mucuna pruriens]
MSKNTTVQEAKNMKTLTLDELLGDLRVHMHLPKRKKLALKDPLTLKTKETSYRKDEKCLKALKVETSDVLDNSSSEITDDEISLMSSKFKQMLKKKGKKDKNKKQSKEEKEVICFEYKKHGHFKVDYPKLKKRWFPKKKESLMVIYEDLDSNNNSKDVKQVNICLMENIAPKNFEVNFSSCNEYKSMFEEEEISYDTLKDFILVLGLWMLTSHEGYVSMLLNLNSHEGIVSFRGSGKGKIVSIGKVGKHPLPSIENVLYVDGLKYNLLSVSQFCDSEYVISFNIESCIVKNKDDNILFTTQRHENLYRINLKHIPKLYKKLLIKGLPLELLHLDLYRPTRILSLGGKKYGFVIIDGYFRYTRVYFPSHKQESYKTFCEKYGIFHNFSLSTPQQNGIVEKKNKPLQEIARTLLCENSLPKEFWTKAINITYLGKFDSKVDKGIFLGYSNTSKAYRVFNSRTLVVEESIHIEFNDVLTSGNNLSKLEEDFANLQIGSFDKPDWKFVTYHPQDLILGDKFDGVKTKSSFKNQASCVLVIGIESKNIEIALKDDDWIIDMEEELHQFTRNNVWKLVPRLEHKNIIGTRWIFRNKFD